MFFNSVESQFLTLEMATTTQAEDIESTPALPPAGPKKHADVETQGLEKVTDYVEEHEIGELTEVREMIFVLV